jgi:hypothetical protein
MVAPAMIPEQSMSLVQGRVNRLWRHRHIGHHLVIAASGSGKTGLIVNGILPLVAYDRMLFIDVKNDTDPMLSGVGEVIGPRDVRQALTVGGGGGPSRSWWRLAVDPINDHANARRAVKLALETALDVGDVVIAADEVRAITGDLGLGAEYESLLIRGRSSGVSVVSAVAATDNMRPAVRTQWAFAWAGAVNGTEVLRATLGMLSLPTTQKIGSAANPYWPVVRDLRQFEWLYLDKQGTGIERNCMARVKSWIPDSDYSSFAA